MDEEKNIKVNYRDLTIRPPFSYSQIIVHAFIYYGYRKLSLSDIYAYFIQEYGYFRQQAKSWKNSVRHLLSLDKRFIKVPREKNERGKGAFWLLDQNSIEEDGTLKAACVARQFRKMPAPRAKKEMNNPDMKPHINPIVEKYLAKIRIQNEKELSPFLVPESSSIESDDYANLSPLSSSETMQEFLVSNEKTCSQSRELLVFDFDNQNCEFSLTTNSFDEYLTEDFLQNYSDDFQF
uniref:Fork-head domain-containing protein n=1 Tax=Panagrolaimus sp. JU765 TaxID=591449 RepID=A0AC34QTI0_9BILA